VDEPSIIAAATTSSAKDIAPAAERLVGGHEEAGASWRLETSWKNRFAASGSKGM